MGSSFAARRIGSELPPAPRDESARASEMYGGASVGDGNLFVERRESCNLSARSKAKAITDDARSQTCRPQTTAAGGRRSAARRRSAQLGPGYVHASGGRGSAR